MTHYAIVSFGGSFPGRSVFADLADARAAIRAAETATAAGRGRMKCDPQVLASVRVQAYETRAAAKRADISDTTDDSRGRKTPGFKGVV